MAGRSLQLSYSPHLAQAKVHRAFRDGARFVVVAAGRRWGKTRAGLEEARRRMLQQAHVVVRWVSPVHAQARARFRSMLALLREVEGGALLSRTNRTFFRLELENGSEIEFWSARDPERLRGEGLDFLVVDEAGYTDALTWYEVLRPMLSDTLGDALVIGTPRGRGQLLHTLFVRGQEGEHGWWSMRAPSWSSSRLSQEEIEAARRELPEDAFRQEFGAEFLEASAGVFKGIAKCIGGRLRPPEPGHSYVVGVDLAQTRDFTVLATLDVATRRLVDFQRVRGESYTQQITRILSTAERYNGAFVMIDETGVGKPVLDGLRATLGGPRRERAVDRRGGVAAGVRVQGVTLTQPMKQDVIQKLQVDLERQRVRFPEIPELVRELELYGYEMTRTGRISYSAPSGFHDDAVIALALANFALTDEQSAAADPLLRRLEAVQQRAAPFLHPMIGAVNTDTFAQHRRDLAEAAMLRRRWELGHYTDDEYEQLAQFELPIESVEEALRTISR